MAGPPAGFRHSREGGPAARTISETWVNPVSSRFTQVATYASRPKTGLTQSSYAPSSALLLPITPAGRVRITKINIDHPATG